MGLYIVLGVVVLAAAGLLVFGFVTSRNQPSVVQERLGRYTDAGAKQAAPEPQGGLTSTRRTESSLSVWFNDFLRERSFFAQVQGNLNAADLKINVGEFFALCLLTGLGGIVIGAMLTVLPDCASSNIGPIACFLTRSYTDATIAGIIGGVVGLFAPNFYLGFRKGRRLKAFDGQLGDTLGLLVNALRSGYSVLQAMEAVGKELPPPVSVEFRRVVQEVQLGLPMETALDHLLNRISSEDLDLVITAINIQREVGGNLAEILDVISHTIRERVRIKGEIDVLTSQGMATGYAITFLPLALMGVLYVVNRPYIGSFFEARNQPCGWAMLLGGLVMIILGGLIIRKIVSIEV
jgi:tight adherence protein B